MGFNQQIGMAAWAMKELHVPPQQAVDMIKRASQSVSRREPGRGEIERWVNKVYQSTAKLKPYDQPKHGIKVEQKLIDEFSSRGSIKALQSKSSPIPMNAKRILCDLYHENSLLHLTPHWAQPKEVKSVAEWTQQNLNDMQFICPAHLKCREMGRCIDNVDHRHYLVYESDRDGLASNWDGQAGCIERLAKDMHLRLIVYSGGKSLHAWFDISTRRKDQVQNFLGLCIQLGADPAALRPAQLVRMPWGIRREAGKPTTKKQKVIFYDN